MDAFPTIQTVENCLKKFRATQSSSTPTSSVLPQMANKVINLDCNTNLSPGRERCMDIQTGEMYNINKRTGVRINNQPHNTPESSCFLLKSSYELSDDSSDDTETNNNISGENNGKCEKKDAEGTNLLEVVACKRCCKYVMVAKHIEACPTCGQTLLLFTKERCF